MKDLEKSVDYSVPGASEKTHKYCRECDGSGMDGFFHDCEYCGGTGIVKKSFKEMNNLD